jgi:hypothetical protein
MWLANRVPVVTAQSTGMNGLPARPITDLTAGLIVILAISIAI